MEDLVGGILGWLGTIGTFTAYVLISRGWVSADALGYSALNAFGGLLGAAGAFTYGAWPALASNLVWGAMGAYGLIGGLRKRHAPGDPLTDWQPEHPATGALTSALVLPTLTLPITVPVIDEPAFDAPVTTDPLVAEASVTEAPVAEPLSAELSVADLTTETTVHEPTPATEHDAAEGSRWHHGLTHALPISLPWLEQARAQMAAVSATDAVAAATAEPQVALSAAA